MKLSIVIVSYNVRYFLEQALHSVYSALEGVHGEVYVVDNASSDDSVNLVKTKFPQVNLIENNENVGFSVANNQAIKQTKGEYVLLLNPDTLVEEDTFIKCIQFMDQDSSIGSVGVKMIDGSGKFLPESKRGFPSPMVAFYKTFGLSKLFPKSKIFNKYHLGHLDENETWEIDVLAGAFMFLRKSVLDDVGLLDEAFFMYGEDIDLSFRIQKAGYKNYYFHDTTIIHYKGESTKKGNLNYVKTFYKAMILFAKKHFTGPMAGLFIVFLNLAIYFRAGLTVTKNVFKKSHYTIFDALIIFSGIFLIKDFWANYFYQDPSYFNSSLMKFNAPLYTGLWIISLFFNGAYDKPFELKRLVRGLFIGLLIIAGVYGFLNVEYRSSRAIILLTTAWALFFTISYRYFFYFLKHKTLNIISGHNSNVVIVGSINESSKVKKLLNNVYAQKNIIGIVTAEEYEQNEDVLDKLENLSEIVQIFNVTEVIFCAKDISSQQIISWMTSLGSSIDFKILPQESFSIIGSSSKENPGELYTVDVRFNISDVVSKRNKRMFDLGLLLLIILAFPLFIVFTKNRVGLLKNWAKVFLNKASWVGYNKSDTTNLPTIKPCVLPNDISFTDSNLNQKSKYQLNFIYAKDYTVYRDIRLIFENISQLGR